MDPPHIVVAGAGSIGCYFGGLLAAAGRTVTLLGRQELVSVVEQHGLSMSSLDGLKLGLPPNAAKVSTDPAVLANADIVLVTVKSGATAEMGRLIATHAPEHAAIVSLQNGVTNAATLRSLVGKRQVLAGMVPFNVVQLGQGRFHRGTSGELVVEAGRDDVLAALSVPHLPVTAADDMTGVLWGKLLLNLNNALNALSGLTLYEQLQQRPWGLVLAAQQQEALSLLREAGIKPKSLGPVPTRLLPTILRLPTSLFRLLAGASVRIDRQARSSMWEDLERRRSTEIDELQGAVTAVAALCHRTAPTNERVLHLIKQAEIAGAGSPCLQPQAIFG